MEIANANNKNNLKRTNEGISIFLFTLLQLYFVHIYQIRVTEALQSTMLGNKSMLCLALIEKKNCSH